MDVIVTHAHADFDALASLVAAKKLYPEARIALPCLVERSVRQLMDLIADLVVLESETDIPFSRMRRLIVVDTRDPGRIGRAAAYLDTPGLEIHCYDHHPRAAADLRATKDIYAARGATVTILVELLKKKSIVLSPLEATICALGIYEDTGSLTFSSTTPRDIDMVGYLFRLGADVSLISSCLNRELTPAEVHVFSQLLDRTRYYAVEGVSVALCSAPAVGKDVDLSLMINKLAEVENTAVVILISRAGSRVHVAARSRVSGVNVAELFAEFGGGGHAGAAAVSIRGRAVEWITARLLRRIRRQCKKTVRARDIMRVPVKAAGVRTLVRDADHSMQLCGLGMLPVVERGRLCGMISAEKTRQAMRAGFGHAPVSGYMIRQAPTVGPDTALPEIRRLMTTYHAGYIPVIDDGGLVGMITRTDILRQAHGRVFEAAAAGRRKAVGRPPQQFPLAARARRLLNTRLRTVLHCAGKVADRLGVPAYIVGGFVRDLLLGRVSGDIDIVVEREALSYAEQLSCELSGILTVYRRFNTAKITLPDALVIDVAMARREYYEYPAALPQVRESSLRQDLFRRDFTINTLAFALNKKRFGMAWDFFGAREDIRQKRIRVLHDLSFVEDPTRILRAVRFEQRLGFYIDRHTEHLIRAAAGFGMFARLPAARLGDELRSLLSEARPHNLIRRMWQLHELQFIHPSIRLDRAMEQFLCAVDEVAGWSALALPEQNVRRWMLYALALADRLSVAQARDLIASFSLRKAERNSLLQAKELAAPVLRALNVAPASRPSRIYAALRGLPVEALLYYMAKTAERSDKEKIIQFLTKYVTIGLSITGKDLQRLAPHAARRYGEALARITAAKLDGNVCGRADELRLARKLLCS
ncbi:MAG: CBS domain-containing protein [Candidatus Omnitrophica bacterium]|nr:CBS domain-containing protein [Candidatus Omnitrophota bacterium]